MPKKKLAVMGGDVTRSLSPQIHTFIANAMGNRIHYERLSIAEKDFTRQITPVLTFFDGLNITIPYKISVLPYLLSLEGDANDFKSVNTVYKSRGYNTDGKGFMLMLKDEGLEVEGKKYLVIGAGGAGRSVAKSLQNAGAEVHIYSRKYESSLSLSRDFLGIKPLKEIQLDAYYAAINASGVGMGETEGQSPVKDYVLFLCENAIDLIYNPEQSVFLKTASKMGKRTINGLAMLFYQAYYSQCIFFDLQPDEEQARSLFKKYKEGILQ